MEHRPDMAPNPAVRRLSLYLRQLEAFARKDRQTVSSKQLGESLHLTDDDSGTLRPGGPATPMTPEGLRELAGVVLTTGEDVERFLGDYPLERLERLQVSFSHYREAETPRLGAAPVERLLRDARLSRLTDLNLGLHGVSQWEAHATRLLAEPVVLPRLRRLRLVGVGQELPAALRARFGLRLQG